MGDKLMNLKTEFPCIAVGCDGTLKFKGSDLEHSAVYTCEKCNMVIAVVNPPTKNRAN